MIKRILYILLFILACSLNSLGQSSQAISDYYRALYYYQNKNNDSALVYLDLCSGDIHCEALKGKIYFEKGNFTKAANIFKSLAEQAPSESYFYLSLIYAEMEFADESISWLEKYFECKNPKSYSQICSHKSFDNISNTSEWRKFWNTDRYSKNQEKFEDALYEINNKNYDEAINILESISSSSREYYRNYLKALAYFNSGVNSEALRLIDMSIKANSKNINAYELKYQIAKRNKDYITCSNIADILLKSDPYNPVHMVEKSEACYLSANYDEAEKYINEYLKYFVDDEDAQYLKVKISVKTKNNIEALNSLNSLIETNPSQTEYFTLRADIYYDYGSWDFAKKDYSMSLDINPNQSETYYKLGTCYFNQNSPDKACYNWNKAFQMRHKEAKKMFYKYCER